MECLWCLGVTLVADGTWGAEVSPRMEVVVKFQGMVKECVEGKVRDGYV